MFLLDLIENYFNLKITCEGSKLVIDTFVELGSWTKNGFLKDIKHINYDPRNRTSYL